MRTLGQDPTEEEVQKMIGDIDYNNDGKISLKEFILLMVKQEKSAEDEEEELVTVFKRFSHQNNEG